MFSFLVDNVTAPDIHTPIIKMNIKNNIFLLFTLYNIQRYK